MIDELCLKVVRLHRMDGDSKLKAYADVSIGDFIVKGMKVVQGQKGLFLSMPQEKGKDGKEVFEAVMVKRRAEMDGSMLKNAMVVRGNLGDVPAVVEDRSGNGFHEAGERAKSRGLARTVGADECHDAPLRHLEADTVQRLDGTVGDVEIFNREQEKLMVES